MPLIQICADLGKKFPCSGGLFHYSREAVGEWGGYAVTALVCGSFILGEILLSYWKTEKGSRSWVYSGLSLLSLSFLVSGFTWKILYSIALTGIGYYCFVGKTAGQKERGEKQLA